MATVLCGQVEVGERGVAWIPEANTKVREIVCIQRAHGYTRDEIHEHFPHLSLAHIHAALAYYHEHQDQIEAEIRESLHVAQEIRARTPRVPRLEALLRKDTVAA